MPVTGSEPEVLASLRSEIVEAQKAQAEFMRWKLLAAGGVGYLAFAQSDGQPVVKAEFLPWLIVLIPLICLYCDLVCTHLQLRIHVIGSYLRQLASTSGTEAAGYEIFVDRLRMQKGRDDPFAVETFALYGSTVVLTGIAAVAAFLRVRAADPAPPSFAAPLTILVVPIFILLLYLWRRHLLEIIHTQLDGQELLRRPRTRAALATVRQHLTDAGALVWTPFPTGLFPATQGDPGTSNYDMVWIRDNVHIANALLETGDFQRATECAKALIAWTCSQEKRFKDVLEIAAEIAGVPSTILPMYRPQIRFEGRTPTEATADWPHAQNDAWGYLLWFVARLLRQEHIAPDDDVLKAIPKAFSLVVDHLDAVRYWEDEDNGHWEETPKVEASSIGAVLAGLRELQALLDNGSTFAQLPWSFTSQRLKDLANKGWDALDKLLPNESKGRKYDAALLFLIYPLRLLDGEQAREICGRTSRHLLGAHGICRYREDTFWGPDYDELPGHIRTAPQEKRIEYFHKMGLDPLRGGGEAQWCLFDPILSIIYAQRALESKSAWGRWRNTRLHQRHLERSLDQVTRAGKFWKILRCPELFYRRGDDWVPNDIRGLSWTAANLRLALHYAARLRKS